VIANPLEIGEPGLPEIPGFRSAILLQPNDLRIKSRENFGRESLSEARLAGLGKKILHRIPFQNPQRVIHFLYSGIPVTKASGEAFFGSMGSLE
jgi:hypothetical protein